MSTVRFVFPKPRLAQLLRTPGGVPVAEALERAQQNLEELKPTCIAELQALLELAQARLDAMGEAFDDEGMADLYAIAVRGIGGGGVCDRPGVDVALTSMCDLLDRLRTQSNYDRAAIAVHVQSWRLLMSDAGTQAGADAVIDGLRKVSARYA